MSVSFSIFGIVAILAIIGLLFGVGYLIVEHFFDKKD